MSPHDALDVSEGGFLAGEIGAAENGHDIESFDGFRISRSPWCVKYIVTFYLPIYLFVRATDFRKGDSAFGPVL
jgi:hypothetical protein